MNLGRQIHTLLKRQASVFVGRLGVFRRIHTPATFDAKRHVFLPPITFIEFDNLGTEGYDFVTYVQQANQLERGEAETLVEQAVSVLLDKLNQSGQVNLDNLGQLVSYGNSYVFKPLDLSGFNYTAVEDEFHVEPEHEAVIPKPELVKEAAIQDPMPEEVEEVELKEKVHEVTVESVNNTSPIIAPEVNEESVIATKTEHLDTSEQEQTIPELLEERNSTSAYIYALVAMVAVVLLGGLYYYSTQMQTAAPVVDRPSSILPLDSISRDTIPPLVSADSIPNTPSDSVATLAEVEKPVVTAPEPKHRYTIVVGTHRTLAQAYEEAEAFNKDGHKSVKVITPNLAKNLKRVVWDTYATKDERDSALRYVQKHIKTDAWPDVIR